VSVLKCERTPARNIPEKADRIQRCDEMPALKILWYTERKCGLLGRWGAAECTHAVENLPVSLNINSLE